MSRLFILLLITFTLGACGQKGDLYLENDKAPEKPAATTSPEPQKNVSPTESE